MALVSGRPRVVNGARVAIPWDDVFAYMVVTGEGPRPAARHFDLPAGTVMAAVQRERAKPEHGRLKGHPLVQPESPAP